MSNRRPSAFLISTILLAFSMVAAPARSRTPPAPQFSSAYTDLNRDCKSALTKREEREAEARGSDIPERCKGYGGYYIYIYFSAWASHVTVQQEKNEEVSIPLTTQKLNYSDDKGRKVEWRMADGVPFAVILRISKYSGETDEYGNPLNDKFKTGEALVVRGLKGYEQIDDEVDGKTPNANAKARQLADEKYKPAGR